MADFIRREDALFALQKAERGGSMTALTRLERAYAEIRGMPAADVAEVVHGRWIKDDFLSDDVNNAEKCSRCGELIGWFGNLPNYCPNCGAKMDGGSNGE
jgi:hypothetical protein|nr:MAG TPA: Transcription initiation factor IIE, alpha FINGER, Transcription [Caudoviricetes sp.]